MSKYQPGPRERRIHSRSRSAQNSKESILVEAKELLKTIHFNQKDVPAMDRREGAWHEMRQAALSIIRLFCMARSNPDRRLEYIDDMVGAMGVIDAMFDECLQLGLLTDEIKLKIARHLDRIDRGAVLWKDYTERQYTALIRAAYGTYDNYLKNGYGVKVPQKYGTFALGGTALTDKYASLTVPTKAGGTRGKYLAMNICYNVSYYNSALTTGKWHLPTSEEGCYLMADETLAAIAPTISRMSGTAINNSTGRWFAERYNVVSARYFSGSSGYLSYSSVCSSYRVQAVTLLDI